LADKPLSKGVVSSWWIDPRPAVKESYMVIFLNTRQPVTTDQVVDVGAGQQTGIIKLRP
jgi:hypothetical protein